MKKVRIVIYTHSTYQYICDSTVAEEVIRQWKEKSEGKISFSGMILHCDANKVEVCIDVEFIEAIEVVEIKTI